MTTPPMRDGWDIDQLPASLAPMMNFERFNLHKPERFRCNPSESDFDMRFGPPDCRPFSLPCFFIDQRHFFRYTSDSPEAKDLGVFGDLRHSDSVLYPIHPTELDRHCDFLSRTNAKNASASGLEIWALPTSSVRTLLVWPSHDPNQAVFVKLPLYCRTFGGRRLTRAQVGRGVGISTLLQRMSPHLPESVRFLYESAGVVPRALPSSGVLFRPIPPALRSGGLVLAPLFSLIGHSARSPPLLLTIMERTGVSFRDFMHEVICSRFARAWVTLTLRHGLMLEAHGQNLLLALSPTLTPLGQFYYRDFQDLVVDWDLRRLTGNSSPANLPNAWSWHETYDCDIHRWNLVSAQLQISVGHYLRFVVAEMELAVTEWNQGGFHKTESFAADEFTRLFSREIVASINESFQVDISSSDNFYRKPASLARIMLKVRTQSISRHS